PVVLEAVGDPVPRLREIDRRRLRLLAGEILLDLSQPRSPAALPQNHRAVFAGAVVVLLDHADPPAMGAQDPGGQSRRVVERRAPGDVGVDSYLDRYPHAVAAPVRAVAAMPGVHGMRQLLDGLAVVDHPVEAHLLAPAAAVCEAAVHLGVVADVAVGRL